MKLLDKLFGKTGRQSHLHIDRPEGFEISAEEAKRLTEQHEKEKASIAPLQQKLKEETAMLKQVLDRKLKPSEKLEIRQMLAAGDTDPMMLAAYLKVPFREVVIIANDVLREKFGNDAPRIPTDVQEYLKLAQKK